MDFHRLYFLLMVCSSLWHAKSILWVKVSRRRSITSLLHNVRRMLANIDTPFHRFLCMIKPDTGPAGQPAWCFLTMDGHFLIAQSVLTSHSVSYHDRFKEQDTPGRSSISHLLFILYAFLTFCFHRESSGGVLLQLELEMCWGAGSARFRWDPYLYMFEY